MIDAIVTFSLKQRAFVLLVALALSVLGVYAYTILPVDAFPDITSVQVEIISTAPGLSAEEIERFVTSRIEMAMRGLPGIVQLRSVTKYELSVITAVFHDDVDIYFARNLVFAKMEEATKGLPLGVEVELGPIATAMGEIYQYIIDGPIPETPEEQKKYLAELRTLQEWVISPILIGVEGVAEINSFGGYFKQYLVTVNPDSLLKYDLTIRDVFDSIEKNNQNVGGGAIEPNSEQLIVRGIGLLESVKTIENIIIKNIDGFPILIKNVAEVSIGEAVRQGASIMNTGDEVVGGIVMMLKGANSKVVSERVKQKVQEINESHILPAGLSLKPYYDRTVMVERSIYTVTEALLIGIVLVICVLYLMLRNIQAALVVVIVLPLSILLTFIIMWLVGIDANLMSLGGLAISLGVILDSAIIQVEQAQRKLGEDSDSFDKIAVIKSAILSVQGPSFFGMLIIILTQTPLLVLEGLEGKMFAPLAYTMITTIVASLFWALTITPVLSYFLIRHGKEKQSIVIKGAQRMYEPLLLWSFAHRWLVLILTICLLIATFFIFVRLGSEFLPIMDEGAFDMDIQAAPGITLTKSIELNKAVVSRLSQFPELDIAIGKIGRTGIAVDTKGVEKSGYVGILKPKSEWTSATNREDLTNQMREALEDVPGITLGFSQPIQCRIDELVAGTRSQLILKLFGENLAQLNRYAEDISHVLNSISGTTDLTVEKITGQLYLTISVNQEQIAQHGLNAQDVLQTVQIAIGGQTASLFYDENRTFDIVVRYPEAARNTMAAISSVLIATPKGYKIPLSKLAEIQQVEGPLQISRENGIRRIGIELNITGRDLGSYVADAKNAIETEIALAPGYYIVWGGQFENQERAMKRFSAIIPLIIALIFLLLFITFRSIRLSLLVIITLPFSLIGGVIAMWLTGSYLSVPASIGFIVLFGIAVLNGVVLVSHISELRRNGMSTRQSAFQGGMNRLRPVLMTAFITIFSLVPLIFSSGPGSEVQRPLAIVVAGGLFSSTLLTLVFIPMIYSWFEQQSTLKEIQS